MKKIKMTLMFCYFYFSGIKESEKYKENRVLTSSVLEVQYT